MMWHTRILLAGILAVPFSAQSAVVVIEEYSQYGEYGDDIDWFYGWGSTVERAMDHALATANMNSMEECLEYNTSCDVILECENPGWFAKVMDTGPREDGKHVGFVCGARTREAAIIHAENECRKTGGKKCYWHISGFDDGCPTSIQKNTTRQPFQSQIEYVLERESGDLVREFVTKQGHVDWYSNPPRANCY